MTALRALLVAAVLAGCTGAPAPAADDAQPPASDREPAPTARFEVVEVVPKDPRRGQEFIVRAMASPPGFRHGGCDITGNEAPQRGGGGARAVGGWYEVAPYTYECRGAMPAHEGFASIVIYGQGDAGWAWSERILLWADGVAPPATRIASWSLDEPSPMRYAATVEVAPPGADPMGATRAAVHILRLDRDPPAVASLGLRVEADGPLAFRGEQDFSETADGQTVPHGVNAVTLAYAYTVNELGGVDVSELRLFE